MGCCQSKNSSNDSTERTPLTLSYSGSAHDISRPGSDVSTEHHQLSPNLSLVSSSTSLSASLKERNDSRAKQEGAEYNAVKALIAVLNSEEKYNMSKELMYLGPRLQKYWSIGKRQGVGRERLILTVAPLSKKCSLLMKDHLLALNSLFAKLGQHPLLQPIYEVCYRGDKLVMFQLFREGGSLRDYLHEVNPLEDWANKYGETGKKSMRREEIALCAKSILEGLRFLYNLGFPPVGHVQSGNIFKTHDGYKLGGYENTLLGYKSRCHHLCQPYGNWIDIIMLGHVIYEMASQGRELTVIVPEADSSDYQHVEDDKVKKFLKRLFSMVSSSTTSADTSSNYKAAVDELLYDGIFASVHNGSVATGFDCELVESETRLLEEVKEGSGKQQAEVKSEAAPDREKLVDIINRNYLSKRGYPVLTADELLSIGTRPGKYWAKVQRQGETVHLLSVVKVSKNCPISLEMSCMKTIRTFFTAIKEKEPHLFPVVDLKYYDGHVLLLQEFKAGGSLRDLIYQTRPWLRWSEKEGLGRKLEKNQIRSYARQLLMACRRLYDLGFPELGQIQSGNIFIEGDVLRLGGFENTLLGYSAAGNEQYPGCLDQILFGHVVFEMATGTTAESVIPSKSDYAKIKSRKVKQFIENLFFGMEDVINTGAGSVTTSSGSGASRGATKSRDSSKYKGTRHTEWIEKVCRNHFFNSEVFPDMKGGTQYAGKMKSIFESVSKRVAKNQKHADMQRTVTRLFAKMRKTVIDSNLSSDAVSATRTSREHNL